MSGSDESGGDWGQASEALFQAARTDHDATPGDRLRVAESLARRLEAAGTLSTGSVAATRAGSLVTVGNGIKVALVVVLAVGTVALMRQVDRSAERAEPKPREASPSAAYAAKSEIQSVGTVPEEVSTRPPSQRVEPPRAAGVEGTEVPRHALRSSRAPEGGKSRAPDTVPPRGTATLRPNAPGETAKPDVGLPAHTDTDGDSAASNPSRRAANDSPAAAHESSTGALPVAAVAADHDGAAQDARAEIAWFERIHAAMRAGQTSAALALCDGHEKRWPQGVFAVEREGVRAIAACVLHTADAAAHARAFLQAYPRTPLVPRVVAACGE